MDKGIEQIDITRPKLVRRAHGKPGAVPAWTSGAKTLVGTAASEHSRVWFTIGSGTLNEIFFPDVDQANTRSIRFLVSDGRRFFSDEAEDAQHKVMWKPGAPCCRIESRCKRGRYSLTKEIVPDPNRDALLMRVKFVPARGADLQLFLFVDPNIGDIGANNDAWIGDYKGRQALVARRGNVAMAAISSAPILQSSCGYAGASDGRTRLSRFQSLGNANSAVEGNVALTAELDYRAAGEDGMIVSLGFADNSAGAAQQAVAGIFHSFNQTHDLFLRQWQAKQSQYAKMKDVSGVALDMYRVSTAVLETHQSKHFLGGFIASASTPWGFARSDEDMGGYHVIWPRDMVEIAMGKLASGDARSARSTLFYLRCTQSADGGWGQNMWLDGTPHADAQQMDAIAVPILLADKLRREGALAGYDALPLVRGAAEFLLLHGPVTQQDRWETMPGYSVYTMAVQVAGLLAAADFFAHDGKEKEAELLRETADAWNDAIDELTYVTGTRLARAHRVPGYYLRIAPPKRIEREAIGDLRNAMPNLPRKRMHQPAVNVVSPDALALVRFGLRAADDPRMVSTVKLLDRTVMRRMKTGVGWTRSTHDGYGEQPDGSPFEKIGVGRCWPLLAGERGHYALAAGDARYARRMLQVMARQTSECGMIPEQVWDARDLPSHQLFNGRPTGSGMPLAWAHAEYIKLLRSLHERRVWDMPPQTIKRYQKEKRVAALQIWTPQQKRRWMAADKDLRIDLQSAAEIRWQAGKNSGTLQTLVPRLGLHRATLTQAAMAGAKEIRFKIFPVNARHAQISRQTFLVHRRTEQG